MVHIRQRLSNAVMELIDNGSTPVCVLVDEDIYAVVRLVFGRTSEDKVLVVCNSCLSGYDVPVQENFTVVCEGDHEPMPSIYRFEVDGEQLMTYSLPFELREYPDIVAREAFFSAAYRWVKFSFQTLPRTTVNHSIIVEHRAVVEHWTYLTYIGQVSAHDKDIEQMYSNIEVIRDAHVGGVHIRRHLITRPYGLELKAIERVHSQCSVCTNYTGHNRNFMNCAMHPGGLELGEHCPDYSSELYVRKLDVRQK